MGVIMNIWVRAIFKSGGFLWILFGLYIILGNLKPSIDILLILPAIKDRMSTFMIIAGVVITILFKKNLSLTAELKMHPHDSDGTT
jgi:hypothetical protein